MQVNEAEAAERLKQLELNTNSSLQKSVLGKEIKNTAGNNASLVCILFTVVSYICSFYGQSGQVLDHPTCLTGVHDYVV